MPLSHMEILNNNFFLFYNKNQKTKVLLLSYAIFLKQLSLNFIYLNLKLLKLHNYDHINLYNY
jgi:hypothetical protein